MIQRVVFDTSTLVSAALRPESVPYQALRQAMATCEIVSSSLALDELARVMKSRKFDRYLDPESRASFVTRIRKSVRLYPVTSNDVEVIEPSCRNPKDNQFLALALVAEADMIVSSDQDLLVLHPWQKLPILTPAQFLERLSSPSL